MVTVFTSAYAVNAALASVIEKSKLTIVSLRTSKRKQPEREFVVCVLRKDAARLENISTGSFFRLNLLLDMYKQILA